MMELLAAIEHRVPSIFSNPEENRGDRIMDAAMAQALHSKAEPALRAAGLDLLQRRVRSFDPSIRQRLFLAPPPATLPLTTTFGSDTERLTIFRKGLEICLVKERRIGVMRTAAETSSSAADQTQDAKLALGVLLALLVLRQGQCSPSLLTHVVQYLHKPLVIADRWAWVDIELPETVRSSAQLRRVLMDPATAAAWVCASQLACVLPSTQAAKSADRREFYRALAESSLKLLQKKVQPHADTHHPLPTFTLKSLCAAQAQQLRIQTMPLIATYAEGAITSSSLTADTWARLLGFRSPPPATEVEQKQPPLTDPQALTGVSAHPRETSSTPDLPMQLDSGEMDEYGFLAELRDLMQRPRAEWDGALSELATQQSSIAGSDSPFYLAVRWLHHLATQRVNKGKRLSDGTLRHYRSLLVARLVAVMPSHLEGLDEDELTDLYQSLTQSVVSQQQAGRIIAAARDFDRFVRTHCLPSLPKARLPGFIAGAYAISSRIITNGEYDQAVAMTNDQSLSFADPMQALQTQVFLALAFRLGMRRSEILGLRVRDIHWGTKPALLVRVNALRDLKTQNARRVLPLDALWKQTELKWLQLLMDGRSPDAYLFHSTTSPSKAELENHPVVLKVNQLLAKVTGDDDLHPHNLRHSFATLALLGMLSADLEIDKHPYAESWMRTAMVSAERLNKTILGDLHRLAARGSAIAMVMGHGHETTTYEHYVHSLDLLLFFASNRQLREETKERRDHLQKGEVALLTALLGYQPTTRIESDDPAAQLKRLAGLAPERCSFCMPLRAAATATTSATAAPALLTLKQLMNLPDAEEKRGFPVKQAELDTAVAVIQLINDWCRLNLAKTVELLSLWNRSLLANDNWSSLSAEDAMRVLKLLGELGLAFDQIDVVRVWTPPKSRRDMEQPLLTLSDRSKALKTGQGRFWIRIPDPRRRGEVVKRHKTQAAVTWVFTRALEALELTSE